MQKQPMGAARIMPPQPLLSFDRIILVPILPLRSALKQALPGARRKKSSFWVSIPSSASCG
jgi:hypothetical protein